MTIHHAHIATHSQDCDGPMYHRYVMTFNEAEVAESQQDTNDFSDIHFRDRVLVHIVSLTTFRDGQMGTLHITEHGFEWLRSTDEGGESANVRWCEDTTCNTDERSQRDVFAEKMGY